MEDDVQGLEVSDALRIKNKRTLERRSVDDLKKRFQQQNRIAVEGLEQDQAPPRISEPRCHVCQSEHRDWIEQKLMQGRSYSRIAHQLQPDEDGNVIDRRSIANHYREHMELDRQAIRDELEIEAEVLKQNVEDGPLGARTDRGILKVLIGKGFDDVIKGVTSVEPKDLLGLMKLLHELNSNVSNTRAEENEIALRTFVRAIEEVCADKPEIIREIVAAAERIRNLDDVQFEMEGIIIRHEPREAIAIEAGDIIDGN